MIYKKNFYKKDSILNIYEAKITSDNGLLIAGEYDSYNDESKIRSAIIKINEFGEVEWAKEFEFYMKKVLLKEINDGYLFFDETYYYLDENNSYPTILPTIIKLNNNGEEVWNKKFSIRYDNSDFSPYFSSLVVTKSYILNDEIVVEGYDEKRDSVWDIIKFSINNNGEINKFNNKK